MAMIQTVNRSQFVDAFARMGRGGQFSLMGLEALFSYLDDLGDGDPVELDVIQLCCDWSEYDTIEQALADFTDYADGDDLRKMTTVLDAENGHVLIGAF